MTGLIMKIDVILRIFINISGHKGRKTFLPTVSEIYWLKIFMKSDFPTLMRFILDGNKIEFPR